MAITIIALAACTTFTVCQIRNWNKTCAAAREQFLKTNH